MTTTPQVRLECVAKARVTPRGGGAPVAAAARAPIERPPLPRGGCGSRRAGLQQPAMAVPSMRPAVVEIDLPDLAATAALARALAERVRPGDVIGLAGELGTGKTTFARAFIHAMAELEGAAAEEVPSPTFTLVQAYDFAGVSVWHFDLYRVERPEDAYELGIEEAFAAAVSLVEWPERLGPLLPAERLELHLAMGAGPETRRATLTAYGEWAKRLRGLKLRG